MSNFEKQNSYKVAWERMDQAIDQGFFLEAVAIQESMIFDRLRSFLVFYEQAEIDNRVPLKKIVRRWQDALNRMVKDDRAFSFDGNLVLNTIAWVDDRNAVIHTIVRSQPGQPTREIVDFLVHAEETARAGKIIARSISDWFRKQKAFSLAQSNVRDVT
jgi:hypothetical protein